MTADLSRVFLFLSTPSARRATSSGAMRGGIRLYFYPRPPRGGRHYRLVKLAKFDEFLSTPSARRATTVKWFIRCSTPISIHALREEGDLCPRPRIVFAHISIHALREEGDANDIEMEQIRRNFYPRPPRGGRLLRMLLNSALISLFLSTPSARRATRLHTMMIIYRTISIHALREEGDVFGVVYSTGSAQFLSTPSARRATTSRLPQTYTEYIFLSTPSARRATALVVADAGDVPISIHALREEGDFLMSVRVRLIL